MRQQYTTAAYMLLQDGMDVDTVLTGVRRAMERRGHDHFYPKVVRDLAQLWERHEQQHSPVVSLAREQDATELADTIAAQLSTLGAPTEYRTEIRPEQVGGSIARYNHRVIDGSYKDALLRLYKRVLHPSS